VNTETANRAQGGAIAPYLMAVLASRFEAIIREMTNTVMKASRSAVIKNARDMSCGVLTYDHRLLSVEEGIPIHITALDLTTRPITEYFDDIEEGDAFLNNCPYTGATHHADLTVCVPVFFEGDRCSGCCRVRTTPISARQSPPPTCPMRARSMRRACISLACAYSASTRNCTTSSACAG